MGKIQEKFQLSGKKKVGIKVVIKEVGLEYAQKTRYGILK